MATSPVGLPSGYAVETPPASAQPSLPSGYAIESPAQQQQPQATMSSGNPQGEPDASLMTSDPLKQAGIKLTMPLVKGLLDAHSKLKEVQNLTPEGKQEHPIQAHIGDLVNKIEGLLTGNEEHPEAGIGTGKYGMLNNPVLASVMGAPEGAELATSGEAAIRGMGAAKGGAQAAEKAPGIIKQAIQGEKVAQEPAKAAIRKFVGAGEETPILKGHETAADQLLNSLQEQKTAAYKEMDKLAGFDVKESRDALRTAEYKIKQPELAPKAKARVQAQIDETKAKLAEAEQKIGPDRLKNADTLNQKWQATKQVDSLLVKATSEDGSNVNVDQFLEGFKKLRNDPKWGDRLEQIGGKESADALMEELRHAQEIGAHALKTQKVASMLAKWAAGGLVGGTAAGIGYEVMK